MIPTIDNSDGHGQITMTDVAMHLAMGSEAGSMTWSRAQRGQITTENWTSLSSRMLRKVHVNLAPFDVIVQKQHVALPVSRI
ncbi:hypothetical protein M404DRAFT_997828 [Pisolithus tinctorius Marx 270]|uniref:Uncharacterized protein n=1 Tax=Pisolithus tinctorius Marx 270 TaxID=870435 RepID=A0A0C3KDI4_PISTI|nr:hypothetical protein M404DRAFT_997828 [Pisolithus tinctorius Marx 270]